MKKAIVLVACLSAVALVPAVSGAQVSKGLLRLSLDTRLIGFTATTVELDESPHTETKLRTFELGLANPEFGMGIGYTVIDGLVIGGRVGLRFSSTSNETEDSDELKTRTFGLQILPYLEYAFNLGKKVVPFVAVVLGYENTFSKDVNADADGEPYYKTVTNQFEFGGGGGIHIFPAPVVSIDASLFAFGSFGKTVSTLDLGDGPSNDTDYKVRALRIAAYVGFSVWL